MSTLSNAEKQRILRERRQARLKKNGTQRLDKITSLTSSFASTESPIQPKSEPVAKPASKNNRISSILDTPIPATSNASSTPEVPQDPFAAFAALNGDSGSNPMADFANNSFLASMMGGGSETAPAVDSEYNKYLLNQFKARFLALRMTILSLFAVYAARYWDITVFFEENSNGVRYLHPDASAFYRLFLALELVFVLAFFAYVSSANYQYVYDTPLNSLVAQGAQMLGMARLVSALDTFSKYYEAFKLVSSDLGVVVAILVITSLF